MLSCRARANLRRSAVRRAVQLAHGHTKPRVTKSAIRATERMATAHMPATRRRAGQLICAFPSDAAANFVLPCAADAQTAAPGALKFDPRLPFAWAKSWRNSPPKVG